MSTQETFLEYQPKKPAAKSPTVSISFSSIPPQSVVKPKNFIHAVTTPTPPTSATPVTATPIRKSPTSTTSPATSTTNVTVEQKSTTVDALSSHVHENYMEKQTETAPITGSTIASIAPPAQSNTTTTTPIEPLYPELDQQLEQWKVHAFQRNISTTEPISPTLSRFLSDDYDSHGTISGEKLVMNIDSVHISYESWIDRSNTAVHLTGINGINHGSVNHNPQSPHYTSYNSPHAVSRALTADAPHAYTNTGNINPTNINSQMSVCGTLIMTSYQLYFQPYAEYAKPVFWNGQLYDSVLAIPLSTIERMEVDKPRVIRPRPQPPRAGERPELVQTMEVACKDGRNVRFGFADPEVCKRALDCLSQYVFPNRDEYLFAFYYTIRTPIPAHIQGWNIYHPLQEYARMGLPTADYRITTLNREYQFCSSYPYVLVVPAERWISDRELDAIAQFRSRARIPVLCWKHPRGRQTIWRCSQPKVGMNQSRCLEDEKLFAVIHELNAQGGAVTIFDCRPKMNARANYLASGGFESMDHYRHCRIYFMNIQNIHVMRESYQKLVRACARDVHDANFLTQVVASGWLGHISELLKATFSMVLTVDRDKSSIVSHCSDGWDRTTQLCALTELCLDPYYRTIRGFCILVEKEWLSFGHKFHQRTGHRDKNFSDDQRSPVFLQWLDCVYQLTHQFPRHFEFNSHFLVTIAHHLYSCRFGTFFWNTEMMRKKMKLSQKTVSLWTYMLASPAAVAGHFTNPLFCPSGNGAEVDYSQIINTSTSTSTSTYTSPVRKQPVTTSVTSSVPAHLTSPESTTTTMYTSTIMPSSLPSSPAPPTSTSTSITSTPESCTPPSSPPRRRSSTSLDDIAPDRKTSLGRGGGDGAVLSTGSVLYPSWSHKKVHLWSDYFLRWYNDQVEHGGIGQGHIMPPYGAAITTFYSPMQVAAHATRNALQQATKANTALAAAQQQIAHLEQQLAALRARVGDIDVIDDSDTTEQVDGHDIPESDSKEDMSTSIQPTRDMDMTASLIMADRGEDEVDTEASEPVQKSVDVTAPAPAPPVDDVREAEGAEDERDE